MTGNADWLGPKTALFKRWMIVVVLVAVTTVSVVEVDSRLGFGFRIPRLLYSIIVWLAQLSSCLLLAGIGIRVSIWILDRNANGSED